MSFVHDVMSKFVASGSMPKVRKIGCFTRRKSLVICGADDANAKMVLIPLDCSEFGGVPMCSIKAPAENSDGSYTVQCSETVFSFKTEREARQFLQKIYDVAAPGTWSMVKKVMLIWLIFWMWSALMAPRPARQVQQSQQQSSMYVPEKQRPAAPAYVAPAQAQHDLGNAGMVVPAAAPIETSPSDPFGLRLEPSTK